MQSTFQKNAGAVKAHDTRNTLYKLHKEVFSIELQTKYFKKHFCAIQLIITTFLPSFFCQRLTCTPFTLFYAQLSYFSLVIRFLCNG